MSDKYNGWTNYETCAGYMWMDIGYYYGVAKASESIGAVAEQMRDDHIEYMKEITPPTGLYTDLLHSAFDAINWFEIAEYIFEDANWED